MKKIQKNSLPPEELVDFIGRNPIGTHRHTWKEFDDDRAAKSAIQHGLFHD